MSISKRFFKEADLILYLAFLWQLPFSWRIVLTDNLGFNPGVFNEYMDVSLYVGEVILISALLIYIINYILLEKSIYTLKIHTGIKMFHMEHILVFLLLTFFIINSALSINPTLSLSFIFHGSIWIIFIYLSYVNFVSRGTFFLKMVFQVIIGSIMIQFLITTYQVFFHRSLGVYFLNESVISLNTVNTAKSEFSNFILLRGYGTFPHPNILSAYAITTYLFFLKYCEMFHVEQIKRTLFNVLVISLVVLSQAKIGILLFFFIILFTKSKKLFHVEQFLFILMIAATLSVTWLYSSDLSKSYETRIDQLNYQSEFNKYTFIGTGIGTYRYSYDSIESSREWWVLEPVHNVPYIVYREIGIIGLILIILIIYKFIYVPRGTYINSFLVLAALIIYLNTDHYLWDIQQGNFILITLVFLILNKLDALKYKLHNTILN